MSAVAVHDVSHRFGARWALARVSAQIPAGQATLLTGANGAGKTTLLRIMSTALRPTRGDVQIFGQPSDGDRDTLRCRIGLLTHQNHIYEDLTARENLELLARLLGRSMQGIAEHLEQVGLLEHADRNVRGYSAGMKRRLCFARLLLKDPELAMVDEPFGQLDPEGVKIVEQLLRGLKARGATLIVSTHDVPRGLALCDTHLELEPGKAAPPLATIEHDA